MQTGLLALTVQVSKVGIWTPQVESLSAIINFIAIPLGTRGMLIGLINMQPNHTQRFYRESCNSFMFVRVEFSFDLYIQWGSSDVLCYALFCFWFFL